MKLKIDLEADALYLTLQDEPASESEEVASGIILDYSADGKVVGIEMLYLSKRSPGVDVKRVLLETVPAAL
ncbi:MAG: DUF2283 domain-containing protein [Calditrichaeota bacterium]|nr:DUF2283 domain-containing protein [Calditrichota bacterium]MBT7617619.1 DUF2283 domain-containing protein [Calditrichota bacterium]MBT7789542.1 DUF2283 domain-containing protein [Calditrichota bacterium]